MRTIRCRIEIQAPRAELFALTQDYGLRPHWDPVHGAAEKREDGRVRYTTKDGMEMTVRYVSHDAPERVAMTMEEGPFYFRKFSGAWVFQSLAERRTEVSFNYSFELRGLLRLGEGVVAGRLERAMNSRLAGLKAYAESLKPGPGRPPASP